MSMMDALQQRRTYYNINKELPVSIEEVRSLVDRLTELVPDAFNMKSSRIVTVSGSRQNALWDAIYDVFEGKVAREKIDSFRAGAGTILYFYDRSVVAAMQEQFPLYAENFPVWANHSSAMLQLAIWSSLRELGIGASLQHYNPVIDANCSICLRSTFSSLRCRSAALSKSQRQNRQKISASACSISDPL